MVTTSQASAKARASCARRSRDGRAAGDAGASASPAAGSELRACPAPGVGTARVTAASAALVPALRLVFAVSASSCISSDARLPLVVPSDGFDAMLNDVSELELAGARATSLSLAAFGAG